MWKVKLVGALLSLFIIGTVIFLVLDPGGDIYNQYLSLGGSSKSGFESKKEFNYQAEIKASKEEKNNSNNTNGLREVVYFNQARAGLISEFGGWEGNNYVDVGKEKPYSVAHSGCGPTSAAEFEAQQGKYPDLANPEAMVKFWAANGLIAFGSVDGERIEGPGQKFGIQRYAELQGYESEKLPLEFINDETKAKEWWVDHLSKNHWVINLLGHSGYNNYRGTPIVWTSRGHFVSFYGLDGDKPITWDVGDGAKAGNAYDFHTIWNDSRPMHNLDDTLWNTAIWNSDALNGTGGSQSAEGINKLTSSMKFYNRLYKDNTGEVVDMECYSFKTTATDKKNFTVYVDAGHGTGPMTDSEGEYVFPTSDRIPKGSADGSSDLGDAFESRSTGESEFTIDIALKLKDLLLAEGYDVIMSRTSSERKVSNGGAAVFANEFADICLSIHWNGSETGTAKGTISFYYDDSSTSSVGYNYSGMGAKWGKTSSSISKSKDLATMCTNKLVNNVGFSKNDGGTRAEYYRILGYAAVPTTLVEVGFGDNATDRPLLDGKRVEIANSLLEAVNEYYDKYK